MRLCPHSLDSRHRADTFLWLHSPPFKRKKTRISRTEAVPLPLTPRSPLHTAVPVMEMSTRARKPRGWLHTSCVSPRPGTSFSEGSTFVENPSGLCWTSQGMIPARCVPSPPARPSCVTELSWKVQGLGTAHREVWMGLGVTSRSPAQERPSRRGFLRPVLGSAGHSSGWSHRPEAPGLPGKLGCRHVLQAPPSGPEDSAEDLRGAQRHLRPGAPPGTPPPTRPPAVAKGSWTLRGGSAAWSALGCVPRPSATDHQGPVGWLLQQRSPGEPHASHVAALQVSLAHPPSGATSPLPQSPLG